MSATGCTGATGCTSATGCTCVCLARRADERDRMYERDQIAREIRELESTRSNKLKRFGDYMPHLLQTINDAVRQGVFHQPPKGPLGVCCT